MNKKCLHETLIVKFIDIQGVPKKNLPLAHFWDFELGMGVFKGEKYF